MPHGEFGNIQPMRDIETHALELSPQQLRLRALELAVRFNHMTVDTDIVIKDAEMFEQYLSGGD